MKKILLPLGLFIIGLIIANLYFGVDVKKLFEGFTEFLGALLDGPD